MAICTIPARIRPTVKTVIYHCKPDGTLQFLLVNNSCWDENEWGLISEGVEPGEKKKHAVLRGFFEELKKDYRFIRAYFLGLTNTGIIIETPFYSPPRNPDVPAYDGKRATYFYVQYTGNPVGLLLENAGKSEDELNKTLWTPREGLEGLIRSSDRGVAMRVINDYLHTIIADKSK